VPPAQAATLPSGFQEQIAFTGLNQPTSSSHRTDAPSSPRDTDSIAGRTASQTHVIVAPIMDTTYTATYRACILILC
jgi:hypothetical protein